jgi:flagellin-like protein
MKLVLREDESGVSEVIGTILILAMTVVLFSSIILWVGSIPTPTTQTRVDLRPSMTPVYDGSGNEIGVNITLLHRGVESLNPALTFLYVVSVRGSNPPAIDREILHKYNPLLGTPSGLLDGSDTVWQIGERWAYLNFTLRSTDQISITIVDAGKNIVVWTARITAPAGTRPPVFVAKWADDLSGTSSIDPIQATLGFILYARVIDPDNDLNRNSVYATVTSWFGVNSTCANAQKMHDDGIYPDIAAGDDVFSIGSNGCQDPPYPSLTWDGSLILMNATDLGGHKTETRLRMTVIPRTSGGGTGTGSWAILIADQTTAASSPLQTATNVAFALLPNATYTFTFWVVFRSASSSTGIRLGLTFPSVVQFSATVEIPITADGTAARYYGFLTFSGDQVVGPSVQAANTDYVAVIEGVIRVSVAGNLQLVFASENSGTTITLRQGTAGQLQIAA